MAPTRFPPPTARQLEFLALIGKLTRSSRLPPTVREIGRVLGITPAGVHNTLRVLVAKGLLLRVPNLARGLFLTRFGIETLHTASESREAPAPKDEDQPHAGLTQV